MDALIRPQCRGFEPYLPGRSLESVRRERGLKRLYKLASNENALGPSPRALKAVAQAGKSMLRYPDGASTALRQALAKKHGLSADRVIIGAGSDELIELLGKTFLNPGDSIVVSEHAFIRYRMAGELMGSTVISVPMRDFTHDLAAMARAIRPDTKMLFIANPNNPTGTYNTAAELDALLQRVSRLNDQGQRLLVVVDEAYYEYASAFAKDYPDVAALQKRHAHLVALRTFSKIYALAGLRVGYAFADPAVISALDRARPPFNVNVIAQAAAEASLRDPAQIQRGLRLVKDGRKAVLPELARMGLRVVPSLGNFALMDVSPRRGTDVFEALLNRGVIVRAMDEYDFPRHIRVTYGLPVENRWFLKALGEVLGA
ncbi:MAG: histidinol-phosphate transaminase [Elusimicrobia bacterium RIFCSPLOWO2_01_FULL_59_12]|nr:MAG: histidinol-phosphate transaminase [Elusimicrobia bacterium RIFCSPLOWO2_01_FULL_59_12]